MPLVVALPLHLAISYLPERLNCLDRFGLMP